MLFAAGEAGVHLSVALLEIRVWVAKEQPKGNRNNYCDKYGHVRGSLSDEKDVCESRVVNLSILLVYEKMERLRHYK